MHDKDLVFQVVEGAKFALQNDRFPSYSIISDKNGVVIASSQNRVISEVDPTAHSELYAIREASRKLRTIDLNGYTLYTTTEPCLMCLSACSFSNIKRVVYVLGKENIDKENYEGNFKNKEVTMKFSKFLEIVQHSEYEEKMKTMMEIWQERQRKYWN